MMPCTCNQQHGQTLVKHWSTLVKHGQPLVIHGSNAGETCVTGAGKGFDELMKQQQQVRVSVLIGFDK
jgi:hypothetical protein